MKEGIGEASSMKGSLFHSQRRHNYPEKPRIPHLFSGNASNSLVELGWIIGEGFAPAGLIGSVWLSSLQA